VTPRVLASTTSHKKEPLVPTLEVFSRLGLRNQRVWVVSGGWCDFFQRPPRIDATFDSVDRQVGIARRLGAGALRLFFGRLKRDDYGPADLDTIGENLWRLSDRHPEMTFVFENHDGASLDPGICRAVFERVNRINIRMNFDPINFERAGVGALGALVTLRPFVAHVHLKGLDHGDFCEFGAGEIDLKPVVRSLVEEDYGGQFTVEYEGKSDGTLRLYQSVQRARADLEALDRHRY
jgi:sugar phosphate isomerase/epimerase